MEIKNKILIDLFKKYRVVGLVGDVGEGKSSLGLNEFLDIKKKINIDLYVLGIEPSLHNYLEKKGIKVLKSKDDLLDMKIKNSCIFIDEFADLFQVQTNDRQLHRIKKFFNRIEHLNNYVLISTAQSKFWNSFMCSMVRAFIVKSVELDNLVNGTTLKRKVKGITENTSEYRLEMPINTFFVVTNNEVVKKMTFGYNPNIDSKKENQNPFEKSEQKKVNRKK